MKKALTGGVVVAAEDTQDPVVAIPPEVAAAMCDWKFYSGALDVETLAKPITYLITAEGVRVVRKTPVGVVVEALKGEPLIALPLAPLAPGLHLGVPKVPWDVLRQIVAFFRAVAKEHKTEALVRIYLHKRTREWRLEVPTQEVGPASVEVDDKWTLADEVSYVHVMDIHSHVDMNAFFSGTDDEDERKAVRLYGVIGKVSSPQPHSSWRMWTGFEFMNLALTDVVEVPAVKFSAPVQRTVADLLMANTAGKSVTVDLSAYDPFSGAEFPAAWMKQLDTRERVTVYSGYNVPYRPGGWSMDDDDAWWGRHEGWGTRMGGGGGFPNTSLPVRTEPLPFLSGPKPGDRLNLISRALTTAREQVQKLVYLVLGDRVTRVYSNGEKRDTKMTYKQLNAMAQRHPKGKVEIFDITPPSAS